MIQKLRSALLAVSTLLIAVSPADAQDAGFRPAAHWVCVNQTGYSTRAPKRFTVPTALEGSVDFYITAEGVNTPLYKGKTFKGTGDFTGFRPADPQRSYVIHVKGGNLPEGVSYPFRIAPFLIEKEGLAPSVWFMNDSRSVTGTHHSAYGGCPWRDGTYYSYEAPSLVWMYLSNPAAYNAMPATVSYDSLKKMVMDPGFKLVPGRLDETALASARKYFTTIDKPLRSQVPDVLMNLHWGIGYYLVNPETKDPSGDPLPRQLHPQTLAQFAFFLYAYPYVDTWFSKEMYQQAWQFTRSNWAKVGLLDVQREVGSSKGRHAPGFSVLPNLLMYEVAKREGWADTAIYMQAVNKQVAWIVDSLNFEDPLVTKGQRMSEHMLMSGIAVYLLRYKDRAPAGLQQKIEQWADIAISRSDNAWDFRKYTRDTSWAVPEYNEVGNVAGFPASALLAAAIVKDPAKKLRLEQLAYAHFDNLYGRNPLNAHAAHHPERGFKGISKGYPKGFPDDVTARLELCRGSLSCLPGTEMYPFNPQGKDRHLEGWIAHNTAWNMSLAVLNWYDNHPVSLTRKKDGLYIVWEAPVTGPLTLTVLVNDVKKGVMTLPENNATFKGVLKTAASSLVLDGKKVPVKKGDRIAVAYGDGFLEKKMELAY
ncbi:hypothetical protein [Chitinophaga qingshengii]|uniref:Cellulase Ig-like domain-containing protein n=1 Tax=Chitinophaga qingshengii TaxID=1569794 RepID=A0ABR7THZ3_9BACT|nr:hypothetical protein [Chitinophaga qingshengii]MBC9929126.1 hypothetical protein [Chitinophaga qingshengii]